MDFVIEELLVPLFAIVGVFGMPVFIVWIVHRYKGKGEQAFHDTVQELIKSGQELSPDVIAGFLDIVVVDLAKDTKKETIFVRD